jgi:hypothetical protein
MLPSVPRGQLIVIEKAEHHRCLRNTRESCVSRPLHLFFPARMQSAGDTFGRDDDQNTDGRHHNSGLEVVDADGQSQQSDEYSQRRWRESPDYSLEPCHA